MINTYITTLNYVVHPNKFKNWIMWLIAVDCIDCAADASVVSAVNEGIEAARDILCCLRRPWVMISVNDDKDLHFRKAGKTTVLIQLNCSVHYTSEILCFLVITQC